MFKNIHFQNFPKKTHNQHKRRFRVYDSLIIYHSCMPFDIIEKQQQIVQDKFILFTRTSRMNPPGKQITKPDISPTVNDLAKI